MKRRILLVGPTGCGKTTLANALNGENRPLKPTLDTLYSGYTLEVPGAYIESPWMVHHIITLAQNHGSHVLLLLDQPRQDRIYSPGFASAFACPVTGVITKTDLRPENHEFCRMHLKEIGVTPPFFSLNHHKPDGLLALRNHLGLPTT